MSKKYLFILSITLLSIFTFLYNLNKSYATISFDIKVIDSKSSFISGEIYYSPSHIYHKDLMKSFILTNKKHGIYQTVEIPITHNNIRSIRLDPLPNIGEVMIKNFSVIQGSLWKKKVHNINLDEVNVKTLKDIKILTKTKTTLHIACINSDPHLEITKRLDISTNIINYYFLLKTFILSLILSLFIIFVIHALNKNYISGEDITITILILLYSIYTILFSNTEFVSYLNVGLPLLATYIIYKQKFQNYLIIFLNLLILLLILGIIVLLSDYANNLNQLSGYLRFLPHMILSIILALAFIHKSSFNLHFYKKMLLTVTLLMGILSIVLHYNILLIDRITLFGYRMSDSPWTQKNYSFFYLFLLWSTISFYHFNKSSIKDLFIIFSLIFISFIALMSGYSDSAKIAFLISLLIYISFSLVKLKSKFLLFIPIIISLYILFTPLLMHVFIYLSSIYPQFSAGREAIYTLSTSLVKEKFFFGYGYKTSAAILLHEYLPSNITALYDFKYLPGRNPHNIPMLIWLNFGFVGAVLFSSLIYVAMRKFIVLTNNKNNQAALLALITSFIIITSFSWSGWWKVTFLTYSYFIAMVLLGMNNTTKRQ